MKLLRVLQSREFCRIGETTPRRFAGKALAATHRDLEAEIAAGRFREDLYYRNCADRIRIPTLREQLAARPEDLHNLIVLLAKRIAGPAQAECLAGQVETWIAAELGLDYPWPGNIRELEQCVRNVLVHGEYHARRVAARQPDAAEVGGAVALGGDHWRRADAAVCSAGLCGQRQLAGCGAADWGGLADCAELGRGGRVR